MVRTASRRRLVAGSAAILIGSAVLAGCSFTVNGCTFTDHPQFEPEDEIHQATCTDWDFRDADLSDLTLFQADLSGSDFSGADLSATRLYGVDLSDAEVTEADLDGVYVLGGAYDDATFRGSSLRGIQFVETGSPGVDFTGADLEGAAFISTWFDGADFTDTVLVPPSQTVAATGPAGAVVSWSAPATLGDATPGPCDHASGSVFPIGKTVVRCQVLGISGFGPENAGTFIVKVKAT